MNCPNGYFNSLETDNLQGKGNLCLTCDIGCLICIGIATNCTKCTTDSKGIIYYLNAIKN